MTLKDFQRQFTQELSATYPNTEIQSFLSILLEEYFGFQRIDLITKSDYLISDEKLKSLNEATKRLKNQEPVQYITGKTEFYGLPFLVNKNVLIPRPETEELVEWILNETKDHRPKTKEDSLQILDIGTGSGCIPIALKKNLPSADVSAIDISEEALLIARRNTQLNEVEINFVHQDILNTHDLKNVFASETKQSFLNDEIASSRVPRNDCKFDIIVSNPPYVRELEKTEIKTNVLENEPHLALFVDDHDPLLFYRKIAELARTHLNENGMLFFEINQYLGKEMLELLRLFGFQNVMLKKDLFGNDRMIQATV